MKSLLLAVVLLQATVASGAPPLPVLAWEEREDWINVRTETSPRVIGDGKADDTAALQAALSQMHGQGGGPKVVYLPPGIYRITRTLVMPSSVGCTVVGHGRETTILWDAPPAAQRTAMLWSNGSVLSRYEGIVWDGAGKAQVGVHHFAHDRFENKTLHQHEAFVNFTEAGVLMGPQNPFATSESEFRNCWFEHCEAGISIIDFNYYNELAEACEFRDCGMGIYCTRYGQIYARDCHFERSRVADLSLGESHKHSVRRCTSIGSHQFLVGREATIQDCHVEGWKSGEGAIVLTPGSPVLMFDCVFTKPPSRLAPVQVKSANQKLIVSHNRSTDTDAILAGATNVVEVPAGERGGVVPSAAHSFFRTSGKVPGKVFDAVRDFKAGQGDSTAAAQQTIDAAREHGQGAIAYFPPRRYNISKTLDVSGRDYSIGGVGYHTEFQWGGEEGGVLMHVHDAQGVSLEELNIIGHSTPRNMTALRHTGGADSTWVTYDRIWTPDGWKADDELAVRGIEFVGLDAGDRVHIARLNGGGAAIDSAAAELIAQFWDSGPIVVQGARAAKPGFFGVISGNGNQIVVRDNLDLVIGDYYCEQAKTTILRASGNGRDRAGRLTIGASRLHAWAEAGDFAKIDGYAGALTYAHGHITQDKSAASYIVRQSGDRPLDILFMANSHPFFTFENSSTARLLLVQNNGLENALPPEGLHVIAKAIDHFRELGQKDLALRKSLPTGDEPQK